MYRQYKRIVNSPLLMTWFNYFVKFGGTVIVMPFVLKKFSAADFNVFMIFQTVFTLFLLTDLGFSQSISRIVSYAYSGVKSIKLSKYGEIEQRGDGAINEKLLLEIHGASKNIYLTVSTICLLFLFLVGSIIVRKPISLSSDVEQYTFLWYAVIPFISTVVYGNVYASYLTGINKVALVNKLSGIFNFGRILFDIIIVIFFPSIILLIINNRLWANLVVIRNYFLVRKFKPEGSLKKINKEVYKSVITTAWKSGLGILLGFGLTQALSLMVAQFNDSEKVASYLLAIKIIDVVSNISRSPLYSKLPGLAILLAKSQLNSFKDSIIKSTRLSFIMYVTLIIGASIFLPVVLKLIDSQTPPPTNLIWISISLAFFGERFSSMHMQILALKNRIIWHYVNAIHTVFVLAIIYFFRSRYGIIIIPISLMLSYILVLSWLSSYRNYSFLNVRWWKFELKTSIFPLLLLLSFFFYFYL